ncbi:hypothetical protein DUI87_22755 [Hirundo rustica rustica]|uniref:Retroviral nucleocapsid Gag protein p24 C-terminal domain-containing protein n=1 Tax=Hirundo rustica rustica TaxID=333673 RepID=A0A3M0JHU4_HIRRU|nr:hypothetical protein DUI87_22755 [Hirundo rustica rustica]
MDQLAGEEAYVDLDQQAVNLLRPILNDIKDAAKKTLMQIPEMNNPQLDFADTRQGPTEPCMTFLGQLKLTIDKQVTEDQVWERLLKQLTVVNDNSECKEVLHALPSDPEPTIPQMVEARNKLATSDHIATIQAQILANALNNVQSPQNNKTRKPDTCNCGQKGRWAKDCSKPKRGTF